MIINPAAVAKVVPLTALMLGLAYPSGLRTAATGASAGSRKVGSTAARDREDAISEPRNRTDNQEENERTRLRFRRPADAKLTDHKTPGDHAMSDPFVLKAPAGKALCLGVLAALAILSCRADAMPANSGNTVQGFYDALLNTMKSGRTLGQSGRFAQLEPVIRRSFDIPSMARLSVGPSWATLTEAQRQRVTESFGRYISAIYADRFDSYAGQKLQRSEEHTSELQSPDHLVCRLLLEKKKKPRKSN